MFFSNTVRHLALPVLSFALVSIAAGCGTKSTTRMVDDPAGEAIEYGAPQGTTYSTDVSATRQYVSISVFESSRCDVIPVQVMQRYQETLHGDEVVQRTPVTKKQVAGEPDGQIDCNQTYARNTEVYLEIDGNRISLGQTDPTGRVQADLSALLKTGAMGETPGTAKVLVQPPRGKPAQEIGSIDLSELARFDARVSELLAELEAVLGKGETGASNAELTRSYELYAQLQDLAPFDPRVEGVRARFWEVQYGRKLEEARERMGRNLQELSKAKDTLKMMGDAAIPIYVQAAVNSGTMDRKALEWSSLRLIRALRGAPTICQSFTFGGVAGYGWPADARVAAHYVGYSYGSAQEARLHGACR